MVGFGDIGDSIQDGLKLVEFRNVSFRYPNAEENVLCNISFTAKPGETTAILGGTGSGKSTLVNLIPRFFDVTEGAVYVDGRDVREVAQFDLRDRIGYIPQKGVLFSGTVESNLRYADEHATIEDLQKAAEIAQAADFIAEMDGGMAAPISQGGSNVSGGQKQRLSIARALMKHPPVYIFDDALSALDFKTDAALQTGSPVTLVVRPEAIRVGQPGSPWLGTVRRATYLGDAIDYEVEIQGQTLVIQETNPLQTEVFAEGEQVGISILEDCAHVLAR